ncbi:MAG: methylmalonyl-CoA mutase family protein [Oligoflexia bacterium]|nr:methylmalonyl-CoA mutase family protein [Oligoflexia bacterium]MBF0366031.1 methylmalonyl-CoA mutase family protein [Oligoflexia bacterium]
MIGIYQATNKIRVVTAGSLFDGHDAAINMIRRILQASGAEVIHLGHNRSVSEIVNAAIQEDVQAVAVTSYQGGHMEYFKYMYDLFKEKGCGHIKIFGGGGGVILPHEGGALQEYGIAKIYSPDDGLSMGLQMMINDLLKRSDFPTARDFAEWSDQDILKIKKRDFHTIAKFISTAENYPTESSALFEKIKSLISSKTKIPILGVTGTGGSGKSSMIDEIICRYLHDSQDKTVGVILVDPSHRKTGGALLGDRIRMNAINSDRVFVRSLATRQSNVVLSRYVEEAINVLTLAEFDLIILETSGIGQSDTAVADYADLCLYIMTPEYGAGTQLEKIDMLDFADVVAINKFDKKGALDALRDVRKQFKRGHKLWGSAIKDDQLPIFGTIASQFNDPGTNQLYADIVYKLSNLTHKSSNTKSGFTLSLPEKIPIIPPKRVRYLSEIADTIRSYNKFTEDQRQIASKLYALDKSLKLLVENSEEHLQARTKLEQLRDELWSQLDGDSKEILERWPQKVKALEGEEFIYRVRGREIKIETNVTTLSNSKLPKISLPKYQDWGDILKWNRQESVPGEFPYTAGVFPFKREGEDPTRMFAGEGGPERTNKRFHFVSKGQSAKRLSTAYDSPTLYGEDPDYRPDIYGKIGNAGVSICCLDDTKRLYSGFNLKDAATSVSMTINGPAAIITAYFMNAAIDQQCEIYIRSQGLLKSVEKRINEIYSKHDGKPPEYRGELPEGNDALGLLLLGISGDQVLPSDVYQKIKEETLANVRGTVQADILKEDQAQNTCVFSTEFSLRLMGDMQEFFIKNSVRNFYSVSISGYHIAEAGANPITQLAFTLANGFTYIEYYLARGMQLDAFAPNLSFFFSNGMEPEYAVIGRVARRIWALALKLKYGGDPRSQMLKYHIQTSGRSLHAHEIDFNDIRTTLQGLYAIFDNCNSLHTNAYDEAITTPTEDSVRRAIAIQLIINKELGLAKNQNPWQGSFTLEYLTDLVEEAVLAEFDRLCERGGVLGAMETMYQRGKIQEESMLYETLKHNGKYPIIGVNTFLSPKGAKSVVPNEVIRATKEEKENQINTLRNLHKFHEQRSPMQLQELQQAALRNQNIFENLLEVSKYCSLGQISNALYKVGGQYRRSM